MPTRAAVLLLALAALAAPAAAATITATDIRSPSGLISCWAVIHSSEIECSAPYLQRIGELDPFLALSPRGKARYSERGDYPGYGHKPVTVHYGDAWKRPGIRCSMQTSGLTCRNLSGHGFHMQRGHVYRF